MAQLAISLFGSFRATLDNTLPLTFRTIKVQALLVYLAAEYALAAADPPRRDKVMDILWPDLPLDSARQNLRQTLYLLRQEIPEVANESGELVALLKSDRRIVQLNSEANIYIDIAHFQQLMATDKTSDLEAAADLYRGEFLADFYLSDSNVFEDWAANYRTLLRNQALKLFETLGTRYIGQARYDLAEQIARHQLEIDALREPSHRQLIETLARSGQQSAALKHYEQYVDLLQAELGVEPTLETQQLVLSIREGNLQPTHRLNKLRGYELRETIGEGSFGVVYKAIQPAVGREVAIKAIRSRYADSPDFIRRFETEAQLIARLEHPHIVPLYDYWREPGGAYLVMRWMRGGSLATAIKNGRFPLDKVVQLIDQIAAALDLAHQQGIIHRDMKPDNILLDEMGNGYLSDFGIAKDLRASQSLTGSGAVLGSPYYLTPEQLREETVTPQSDIYGLGFILYELLVGEHPYSESTPAALFAKHLDEPVPTVSSRFPELPATIDQIIQQATAKQPTHRFTSANEMAQALHGASHGNSPLQIALPPTFKKTVNPYMGLRPFEEADASRFFGRDLLTDELLTRLEESRFLAIVGPSGSGKSSVVKAGLIPALRQGSLPTSEQWFIAEMVPGTFPLEELEVALLRVAINPPPTLLTQLQASERGLAQTVKRILPPGDADLLLLVDQFEELFTLVTDEERRRFFLNSLVATIQDSRSRVRVIITLRADFYDRPLLYQSFGELVREHTEAIIPPTRADLIDAISEPAKQVGVTVKESLVSAMVNDVYDQPGVLPLLQYALTELFDRRQDNEMTLIDYDAIGQISGALANRAEALYQELDENGQAIVPQLFLRLVTLGEAAEDTRRRVLRSELDSIQLNTETLSSTEILGLITEIIDQYGRYRLLSFDYDPATRAPTVEVAHEALLTAWPRFHEWIATNRDGLRQQRRLHGWTTEWEAAGRDSGLLLRGSRLDQMVGWMAESELALSDSEMDFFEASLQARQERIVAEETRRQRELETAQQLAQTEHRRAQEQATAAYNLRRRAIYLGLALVIAVILAIAAAIFSRQSGQNAVLAATGEAQALTNLNLAQTRQAEANVEADARATAQAKAELSEQEAIAAGAAVQAESFIRATAEVAAVQRQQEAETERLRAKAEARIAFSRELAAAALTNLEIDPDLSILLGLQAVAATYTEDGIVTLAAENTLHRAISNSHIERTLPRATHGTAVSPDGLYFAAVYEETERVIVWDVATWQEVTSIQTDHLSLIYNQAFSPDGTRIATASTDGTAKVWEIATGQLLLTLSGHTDWVTEIVYSPDGTRLATQSDDNMVKVWDAASGQELLSLPQPPLSGGLAFSPDGVSFAMSGAENTVKVRDIVSGEEVFTLSGHNTEVSYIAYSLDGRFIAAIAGSIAKVWDAASGQELLSVPSVKAGSGGAFYIAFSPDGNRLAAIHGDGKVRLWDIASGQESLSLVCTHNAVEIIFSPDGLQIITSDGRTIVQICTLSPDREWYTDSGYADRVYGVAFSPNGTQLASASRDGTARVLDFATGQELFTLVSEGDRLFDITYSPDGALIATTSNNGIPRVWDTATGQEVFPLIGHTDAVWTIAFSPDGARIATASNDGTARVWDTATGQELLVLDDHTNWVLEVAFSPDGALLATSDFDQTVIIWDVATGEALLTLDLSDGSAWGLAFSPDGARLAAGSNVGNITVWDVAAFLADGSVQEEVAFSKSGDTVMGLAFSPDGEKLATAGHGSVVTVWDIASGEELLTLSSHTNTVWDVAFSPDGTKLATASWDGTARVYVLPIEELVALAQERVTRWWRPEECQQYLHQDTCPERPDS